MRRGTIGMLVAGLVASPLALGFSAAPVQANPAGTGVVIKEVYGGGGSTSTAASYKADFVELYNPTSAPISLNGWSIQYRSATGTAATAAALPSKVVPANDHFLVSMGTVGTGGADLPATDATAGSLNLAATSGLVILSNGTSALTVPTGTTVGTAGVVDAVGYGSTVTSFETARTGVAGANNNSVSRTPTGGDSDSNLADFAAPATPSPVAAAGNTTPAAPLAATNPGTKNVVVNESITPFTLAATGGTPPITWTSTALPAGLTLAANGTVSGTPTATGTTSVTATATDSATPTPATATATFDIVVTAAQAVTPIAQIQGTGAATPLTGSVTTEGKVTASFPTGGLNGFYIQTPGADTADASDGIFVYGGPNGFTTYPAIGDSVRVSGTPEEFFTTTQISNASVTAIAPLAGVVTPKTVVPGTDCALPGTACLTGAALDTAREVAEGEAFQPTAPWTATDVYDFGPYYTDGTNNSAMRGEIGLAAASAKPLIAPTEIIDAQATALKNERIAYNNAHRIILDDSSSLAYSTTQNSLSPFPWLTATHAPRVGAAVTFPAPVIFTFGFNQWRLQPTTQVVGAPSATQPQFAQTRAQNLAPQDVGGDVKLATFNVLNFFPTTGNEFVSSGLGTCTYFTDRQSNQITNNQCNPSGPRGAANDANLVRQRDKIVAAINTSGADVVSLEELENSVKFNKPRDFAIDSLVTALNAAAGAGTWAAVPSPAASELPAVADQDVIRNGFIYKPGNVALMGTSDVLQELSTGSDVFSDAREPVAQAFKKVGTPDAQAFAVIVNHFKSKGSGNPDPDGQGNANERRVGQANALVTFANQFKTARGITRVFLAGDFNAYSEEDPIQVLKAAGYTNLESSSNPDEESYNYDGQIGSLDHVLANAAALADVDKVDIWEINGNESVYYEYARFNTNISNLYTANPFRSSDHSPEIVGIKVAAAAPTATVVADDKSVAPGRNTTIPVTVTGTGATPTGTVTLTNGATTLGTATLVNGAATINAATAGLAPGTYTLTVTYNGDGTYSTATDTFVLSVTEPATRQIQILGTNDFHGRLLNNAAGAPGTSAGTPSGTNTSVDQQAGAAILSGAVKQLRGEIPDTVFAAAGDLIGASTFESFIQNDNPTIDALNAAGLEVSAAGNHEFDQGYEDLVGRVQSRANWEYIAANVDEPGTRDDLAESWTKTFGSVKVGFVGAVTEDLPSLVSPAGIQGVTVTDIVEATNTEADLLKAGGADVIVLLVHEGAPTVNCDTMDDDPTSAFGSIINGVNANVDAIISGHTHMLYNCSFPVRAWSGRPVTDRPVVSAGQYGTNLNKLVFTVDTATGAVQAKTQAALPLKLATVPFTAQYSADPAVTAIVADAITAAAVPGAVVVGKIKAPFSRAKFANGVENRGGESTLGNLVAEIQRYATRNAESGAAQIAFMNPGGLRADLAGTAADGARTITYREAANVQPFANTLVNMRLTGAQIETVLEQQWQTTSAGAVPSRPFLKLGQSNGFEYTYYTYPSTSGPARTVGEVTSMTLGGAEIVPTQTYSVTVNSFLASGGDNFRELVNGTGKRDTGKSDLQAQVDYFEEVVGTTPLAVDYSQRAVGAKFPNQGDTTYRPGETVTFDLTSLIMTGVAGGVTDLKDSVVEVRLGDTLLASPTVDQTLPSPTAGTAADNASTDESGKASVSFVLPAGAPGGLQNLTITGPTTGTEVQLPITVERFATRVTGTANPVEDGRPATVDITVDAIGSDEAPTGSVTLTDGTISITADLVDGSAEITVPATALSPGNNEFTLTYSGNGVFDASTGSVTVRVAKAAGTVTGTADPVMLGNPATVIVTVSSNDASGPATGTVTLLDGTTKVSSVQLVNGTGNLRVPASALEVGRNEFALSYSGDDNYAMSTGSVIVTVTRINGVVTATAAPISYGQAGAVQVAVGPTDTATPTGSVTVTNGATEVGTVTLGSNGTGTLSIPARSLAPGTYTFGLAYAGDGNFAADSGSVTVTVVKATPTVTANVTPVRAVVYKNGSRFAVTVTAPGFEPTGTVQLVRAGAVMATGTLNDGRVTISTAVWRTVGTQSVQVRYLGDANAVPASTVESVVVIKQTPAMSVDAPTRVREGARPTVVATLDAVGTTVTGQVSFTFNGRTVIRSLSEQEASLRLPKLTRTTKVTVTYRGNGVLEDRTITKTIRVG